MMSDDDVDRQVQDAILEYLCYYDFNHTAECMKAEVATRENHWRRHSGSTKRTNKSKKDQLVEAFQAGNEEKFCFLWENLPEKQLESPVAKKLEFDLRLFFAVFPMLKEDAEEQRNGQESKVQGTRRMEEKRRREREVKALERKSRMSSFDRYLKSRRGQQLSTDAERCPFYALPCCESSQIRDHPVFQSLFDSFWEEDVQRRLVAFLEVVVESKRQPDLCKVFRSYDEGKEPERFEEKEEAKIGQEQKEQQNHHDPKLIKSLYATAVQILQDLQKSREVGGEAVEQLFPEDYMTRLLQQMDWFGTYVDNEGASFDYKEQDMKIFRSFSKKRLGEGDPSLTVDTAGGEETVNGQQPGTLQVDDENQQEDELEMEMIKPLTSPTSPKSPMMEESFQKNVELPIVPPLDYDRLKEDLTNLVGLAENDPKAEQSLCLILQALRWRISRTPPFANRLRVLEIFVFNDLFNFALGDANLLMVLLGSDSLIVKEYALRLMNYFVSMAEGRKYLQSFSEQIVDCLHNILTQNQWHFPIKGNTYLENVLACFQKLSINKVFCEAIIEKIQSPQDLLQTIMQEERSIYVNEYLMALLLNLTLQESFTKSIPEDQAEYFVQSLETILSGPENPTHSYAVAILFAILKNEYVQALLTNDGDHVAYLRDLSRGDSLLSLEIRKQLYYIVNIIRKGQWDEFNNSSNNENDGDDEAKQQHTLLEEDQDLDQQDIAPEVEADEHPSLRESRLPSGMKQGEQLLIFAYSMESTKKSPKSPIMRMLAQVPDEMKHKPKLKETPRD